MKKIVLCSLLVLLMACNADSDPDPGCIDPTQITAGACPLNFEPVCGCDGKTYGNSCEADRDGVVSYTQGACSGR